MIRFLYSVAIVLFITACGGSDDAIPPDATDDTTGGTDDTAGDSDDTSTPESDVDYDIAYLSQVSDSEDLFLYRINDGTEIGPEINLTQTIGITGVKEYQFDTPYLIFHDRYFAGTVNYYDIQTGEITNYEDYFNPAGTPVIRKVQPSKNKITVIYYLAEEFEIEDPFPLYASFYDRNTSEIQTILVTDQYRNDGSPAFTFDFKDKYLSIINRRGLDDEEFITVLNVDAAAVAINIPTINPTTGLKRIHTLDNNILMLSNTSIPNLEYFDLNTGELIDSNGTSSPVSGGIGGQIYYESEIVSDNMYYFFSNIIPSSVNLTSGLVTQIDNLSIQQDMALGIINYSGITRYRSSGLGSDFIVGARAGATGDAGGVFFTDFSRDYSQALSVPRICSDIFVLE